MQLFLLLALLIHIGEGCMAGYQEDRDRLREYLGIEWVERGLAQSGVRAARPIRHSHDLSCNFSRPEKCRWKNAEAAAGMDSRDFHLFEKQDLTEWPPLRLQPGPTKIAYGEKMIFTGDRLRDEQTALFFSSVIPCQKAAGNLTFTYWAYNNARVEVVLLEDDKESGKKKMLPEKPYIDCGTVPVNTACHAEIPPRQTPFRLGLRAYDMANTEGSFIIIDDIIFNADLCKLSIDLGESFTSSDLVSSASGEHLHKASDLLCIHFDMSCRWRSTGKTKPMWKRSTSPLPSEFVMQVTGSQISPRESYAILYIQQDTELPLEALRSDPIQCQAVTDNEFTYRFWASADVVVEACAVSAKDDSDIECHRAPAHISPAPVHVFFATASKDFYIAIRVASLKTEADSVLIVDDISYKSTFCNEAVSPLDFGAHFVATRMLSVLLGRHLSSAKELWCDFTKRGSDCAWGFVEAEAEGEEGAEVGEWQIGHGPLDNEKFYSLTGQTLMPNGEFGVARFEAAGSALLLSEVLICILKTATLSFHLWLTGTASLNVCLVEENSPSLLDCQTAVPGPVTVELPRVERPFRIALRADSEGAGIVMVDHIQMHGDICGAPRQYSAKSFRPSGEVRPDANVCRLLSCGFSRGHPCLYDSSQLQQSAQFSVGGGVLSAQLNRTRPIAILESVPFQLNTIARLHFIYSIFGNVALFVCNDSAGKELENCFRVEGTGGDDYVELLPSDTKVYLMARGVDGGVGSLQVKRLLLTDVHDEPAC